MSRACCWLTSRRVIVVTHNLEIVKNKKKRVITIKKGLVVSDSKDGDSDED